MTTHNSSVGSVRALIERAKRRDESRQAREGHHVIKKKNKPLSAEARARVDAFNAKHGIRDPRAGWAPGLKTRSHKKVTLPQLNPSPVGDDE